MPGPPAELPGPGEAPDLGRSAPTEPERSRPGDEEEEGRPGDGPCTVIVTVDAPPELIPDLEAHARMGLERFPDYEGFLEGALHNSGDGRLVQHLRWASEAEFRACIEDPAWDDLPSTQHFLDAMKSGQAKVDARVFEVVARAPTRLGDAPAT